MLDSGCKVHWSNRVWSNLSLSPPFQLVIDSGLDGREVFFIHHIRPVVVRSTRREDALFLDRPRVVYHPVYVSIRRVNLTPLAAGQEARDAPRDGSGSQGHSLRARACLSLSLARSLSLSRSLSLALSISLSLALALSRSFSLALALALSQRKGVHSRSLERLR